MSLAVSKLYQDAIVPYKMQLLAGKDGLSNLVQWLHILEDEQATQFLHGNELVFTAGIHNQSGNWLLNYAKDLYKAGASAFVVNLGPHIQDIPEEVIDFCEEVNMPLFTIPWETRMVDMTRDFCEKIIDTNNVESNMSACIQNILFQIGDAETQVLQMERYGYMRDSSFCFISVNLEDEKDILTSQRLDHFGVYAEKVARSISKLFIHFIYQRSLILVLVNYLQEDVEKYIAEFMNQIRISFFHTPVYLGVSSNLPGMMNQENNFRNTLLTGKLATKLRQTILYFDKLGLYKILIAVNDRSVIKSYYDDLVGKVENYDLENGTDYVGFLRAYIQNNGSPQLVSEQQYIHRNTVNNTLKKIEKITGYNLTELENKVKCTIGLYIKDVL